MSSAIAGRDDGWRVRYLPMAVILTGLYCVGAGCVDKRSSGQPSSTIEQRQEEALRDPFGYEPDDHRYDISGGDIRTLDRKALKRDLDTLLNP